MKGQPSPPPLYPKGTVPFILMFVAKFNFDAHLGARQQLKIDAKIRKSHFLITAEFKG